MSVATTGELIEKIGAEVIAAEHDALETWRRWAQESDIRRARVEYRDSIDIYEAALRQKRTADETVKELREQHASAVADVEYALEAAFEKKGASWVQTREFDPGVDGNLRVLDEPRPVDAAGRRDWLARTAAKSARVADAADLLAKAEWGQAQAVDGISVSDRKVTAAKYQLQAATAMLTTLAQAMPDRRR
jgi:hypothetical protein